MSKKQKDWLQVNAIVALVFSIIVGVSCIALLVSPGEATELMKALPPDAGLTSKTLMNVATALLVICSLLLIHVVWTYLLIRRNKMYFKS